MNNEMPTEYPGVTPAEWCEIYGYGSIARLAKYAGVHWRTMRDIVQRGVIPSPRVAVALEIGTCGQIRAEKVLRIDVLRAQLREEMADVKKAYNPLATTNPVQ